MEAYQIIPRKYRPQTFEEVVGQKAVVQTLRHALDSGRIAQAYIFSGMRGVGKTTVARILAKAVNCLEGPTSNPCNECPSCLAIRDDRAVDVIEIDGASNRGVEEINEVRDTAKVRPIQSRYKVIIIDEVHMLSRTAFNALLKTLEEPPPRVLFIFATTEFHKVPPTVVSRCQHFEFKRISPQEIKDHLLLIAGKEKIKLSESGAQLLAEAADGSLRDAQSLLDKAVAYCGPEIKEEALKEILGVVPRTILFEASSLILEGRTEKAFSFLNQVVSAGYDLKLFYDELVRHFRNLLMVKTLDEVTSILSISQEEVDWLKKEAEKASTVDLLRYLQALLQAEAGLRYTAHPQIYLEALLVRLGHLPHLVPLKEIFRSLEEGRAQELVKPLAKIKTNDLTPAPEESLKDMRAEALNPAGIKTSQTEAASVTEVLSSEVGQIEKKGEDMEEAARADQKEEKNVSRRESRPHLDSKEKEAVLSNPAIKEFMSLFQARLVSIDPIARPQNGEEV